MSDARSEVLLRVRAALPRAVLPKAAEPRGPAAAPAPDLAELIAEFKREAAAVGCTVHGPLGVGDAGALVLEVARETAAGGILAWSGADLPLPGLRSKLVENGFRLASPDLPAERPGRLARLRELEGCGLGLTGASAGLADSGTLVLASGPGRPRLSWLLPPVHLALLSVARLRPNLASFLAGARDCALANANLVLVTGPSRTGDIELILTRGVHGPGVVHVILLG